MYDTFSVISNSFSSFHASALYLKVKKIFSTISSFSQSFHFNRYWQFIRSLKLVSTKNHVSRLDIVFFFPFFFFFLHKLYINFTLVILLEQSSNWSSSHLFRTISLPNSLANNDNDPKRKKEKKKKSNLLLLLEKWLESSLLYFPSELPLSVISHHIDEKYQDNEVVTREPPGDKAYSEIPWHITGRRTGTPRYAFMLSNCRWIAGEWYHLPSSVIIA